MTTNDSLNRAAPAERSRALNVYLLSLGCVKNLVDSECMSKIMQDAGHQIVDSPELADILLVNTCGFIEQAKKESIDAILWLASYKDTGDRPRYLAVAGCLSQRYAVEIRRDLPEVDAIMGTADYSRIGDIISGLDQGDKRVRDHQPGLPGSLEHLYVDRQSSGKGRYAYVKIAEGCSNCCSYCAIPGIRGPYRSRPLEDIVAEADRLAQSGRDEVILIAQDTTRYGVDLYGQTRLVDLLDAICSLPAVRQVRLLYVYADSISDQLIQCINRQEKIARYLDMPIQHAADPILKSMNRRDTQQSLRTVIRKLRESLPGLILRTTVMVGFPGETEIDFQALLDFLVEMRFERLGCFIFSPEEGTPAFSTRPRVHAATARRRYNTVMKAQQQISLQANQARLGHVYPVTLESIDDRGIFFIGRSYGEAPDVDPVIYVAASTDQLQVGQTCRVRLVEAGEYDMTGVTVD